MKKLLLDMTELGAIMYFIYEWRAIVLRDLATLFGRDHKGETALKAEHQKRLDELYAEIGRLTTQVNWLKKKSGYPPDPD